MFNEIIALIVRPDECVGRCDDFGGARLRDPALLLLHRTRMEGEQIRRVNVSDGTTLVYPKKKSSIKMPFGF